MPMNISKIGRSENEYEKGIFFKFVTDFSRFDRSRHHELGEKKTNIKQILFSNISRISHDLPARGLMISRYPPLQNLKILNFWRVGPSKKRDLGMENSIIHQNPSKKKNLACGDWFNLIAPLRCTAHGVFVAREKFPPPSSPVVSTHAMRSHTV